MRFEALHQKFKRFARNSGFRNVGKTMAKRFQKVAAFNFKNDEKHPLLQKDVVYKEKNQRILYAIYFGKILRPNKEIIIAFNKTEKKEFGILIGFEKVEERVFWKIEMLNSLAFENELLSYKVERTNQTKFVYLGESWKNIGAIYKIDDEEYVLFDQWF